MSMQHEAMVTVLPERRRAISLPDEQTVPCVQQQQVMKKMDGEEVMIVFSGDEMSYISFHMIYLEGNGSDYGRRTGNSP